MIKLLTIVGARPQFIKAAALSRAIKQGYSDQVKEVILHTGQHYDDSMSDIFFRDMQIPLPDYNLKIGSGSHGVQTGKMMEGIEKVILEEKPEGMILFGDTNSTLAGSMAASKLHIPVIHIEAGLRSFNKKMPEEINRIACDHVSTLLFSPTETGIRNLKNEGIIHHEGSILTSDAPGVYHSGDVMYDNTLFFKELALSSPGVLGSLDLEQKPFILATIHRPSNTDIQENLNSIMDALDQIAKDNKIDVVLPMHPRTSAILKHDEQRYDQESSGDSGKVRFIPAVSFLDMVRLEAGASIILTDSGGVQKEAWFMKKPVVVLREETEWVEIIENGNGILAGADTQRIVKAASEFLNTHTGAFPDIFGDGQAAHHILEVITTAQWQ